MRIYKKTAFTLIELLTVIAIIGILAAILIPAVGAAKNAANKAKTKVQFNQWAVAMGMFKQEYGYYPKVDNGTGKLNTTTAQNFAGALAGTNLSGTKLASTDTNLMGNVKVLSFYSIAQSDLDDPINPKSFVDAFGNTDIAVFYDKDGDGLINAANDGLAANPVTSINTTLQLTPPASSLTPGTGVRAGVIFYSAGKGGSASDIVYSWQ